MAARALGGRAGKVPARVALGAVYGRVGAGQRELSIVVIESRIQPRRGVMATWAILRESGSAVIRIRGSIEIRQVTGDAGGGGGGEVVIGVTLRAIQPGVRSREGEVREFGVIELCPEPAVHGVALLAVRGEVKRRMAGIVGFLKVRGVA